MYGTDHHYINHNYYHNYHHATTNHNYHHNYYHNYRDLGLLRYPGTGHCFAPIRWMESV